MTASIVFLDTETLGLDPGAPIWEFAAIRCTPGYPVQKREFFIEHDPADWVTTLPTAFQDDYHIRYHPLSALDEGHVAEEIHFITNGAVVIGSNPGFDTERLALLLRRNGIELSWHYHSDDIASMAAGFLAGRGFPPPRPWKSDRLSLLLGVDPADYQRHTAIGDVRWIQAQYNIMFGGAA